MSKENFYTLLSRYKSGNCTDQEKRLVEQWFAILDEEIPERSIQENSVLEERIWNAIQQETEAKKPAIVSIVWKWAVAAMVILALGWGGYRFQSAQNPASTSSATVTKENFYTETNHSDVIKTIELPDSSEIQLSPNSSIS